MSRRLTYVALVLTSLLVAACAQPLAPARGDTACRSGWTNGSGDKCTT